MKENYKKRFQKIWKKIQYTDMIEGIMLLINFI